MMRTSMMAVLAIAVLAASASSQAITVKEDSPGLLKQAKVSTADAMATAQAKLPKSTLQSAEIEKEHGKLIYSFEFTTPGKTGTDEVNVDAMTGKVVSVEHESPEAEKAEKAKPPR